MQEAQEQTFGALLRSRAERHPDKDAVIVDGDRLSYAALSDRAARVAGALRMRGIRRGDRVAVWLDNSAEWVVAYFAIAAMGATLVPLNTRFRRGELAHTLALTRVKALIVGPGVPSAPFPDLVREVAGEPSDGEIRAPDFPDLRLVATTEPAEGFLPWADLASAEPIASWEGTPDDVAFIQFTSGTTGLPKGVALRSRAMFGTAAQIASRVRIDGDSRLVFPGPLYHVFGAVLAVLGPLDRGGAVVLTKTFDAGAVLDLIERERCTVHFGLETMFLEELLEQEAAPRRIDSLRTGLMAGSPALVRDVHDRLGITGICTGYGMSETAASAATTEPDDPLEVRMTTVGRPLHGCEVQIVDTETNEPLPAGARGEICMRGTNVFDHYDNQPEATAAAFDDDGWFHSGDEGSLDADGRLRFHGRLKDIIRVGGENVSPLEVETLITGHPGIKLAQVVGAPDERLQELPVAFVELIDGGGVDEAELLGWCRGRLASFKLPRHVVVVEEWPMTGSGRIQRHELRRIWAERRGGA